MGLFATVVNQQIYNEHLENDERTIRYRQRKYQNMGCLFFTNKPYRLYIIAHCADITFDTITITVQIILSSYMERNRIRVQYFLLQF